LVHGMININSIGNLVEFLMLDNDCISRDFRGYKNISSLSRIVAENCDPDYKDVKELREHDQEESGISISLFTFITIQVCLIVLFAFVFLLLAKLVNSSRVNRFTSEFNRSFLQLTRETDADGQA